MKPYYFLRHAQSAPTPDRNESDWPLSPAGQQAQKLSIALCNCLLERRVTPDWIEDFMGTQARSWNEIHWKLPGGESAYEGQLRTASGVKKYLEQQAGPLLFVGHGNAISLSLRSLSPEIDFKFWRKMPMPTLIEVHHQEIRHIL